MLRIDILLQLHKKAFAADERVQWIIRLHLVDLISRQIAFTKRRHAEVNEAGCQRGMTQPASSVLKRPNVQRRAILKDLMHAIPCVPFPGVICYSRIETSRSETGILAPVSFSESVRLVYIPNVIGDFIFLEHNTIGCTCLNYRKSNQAAAQTLARLPALIRAYECASATQEPCGTLNRRSADPRFNGA